MNTSGTPAAAIAACLVLGVGGAAAAPVFSAQGDAAFRNITATGGTLAGVDVSNATVVVNGAITALTALALEAAQAVPASMAGQPNGWLKLDGNGLVPSAALPAAASGVDQTARAAAAAAQAVAAAAEPAGMAGKAGGWAVLDANALVPLALLPASVASPVDATARAAATAAAAIATAAVPAAAADKANGWLELDGAGLMPGAMLEASGAAAGGCPKATVSSQGLVVACNPVAAADLPVDTTSIGVVNGRIGVLAGAAATDATARGEALAAQATAGAAEPSSQGGKAGGFAVLDGNALVPVANLPSSVTSPVDSTARSAAAAAQSLAAAAEPAGNANKPGGWAQLDGNGDVLAANLPSSVTSPVDSTARSAAAAAQSLAAAAEPAGNANKPNGWAQLDASGFVLAGNLPASVTSPVDSTARSSAASAQSTANAAQTLAAAAVPMAGANKPSGWAQLDGNGFVPAGHLPASVTSPVDQTARNSAAAAQALAVAALPVSQANKANGFAQLDASALVLASEMPVDGTTIAVQSGRLAVIGGTGGVDSTARAAASAAQSLANAAEPSSQGGKAGGFALLDTNALVPAANLPAAFSSASAIAVSTLGQANGPAQLGADGTISTNTVLASLYGAQPHQINDALAHEIDGETIGLRCGSKGFDSVATITSGSNILHANGYRFTWRDVGAALYGSYQMGAVGNGTVTINSVNANGDAVMSQTMTASASNAGEIRLVEDDTAAFQAWIAAAGKWTKTDMVLPAGDCRLSAEIDVPVASSMHFHGRGPGASTLTWTAPTNGLVFTIYADESELYDYGSSFTLDDFAIRKAFGTNSVDAGTAITVRGAADSGGVAQSSNTNDVVEHDILVGPSSPAGQTDGWLTSIANIRLAGATIYNIGSQMPGWGQLPNPKSLPNPLWGQPSPQWPGAPTSGNVETVTTTAAAGQNAFTVSDATSFQAGQRLTFAGPNVLPTNGVGAVAGYITAISGNTVQMNENFASALQTTYSDQYGSHPMTVTAESTPNLTNWHAAQTGASGVSAAGGTVIDVTDATNAWPGEIVSDSSKPASLPPLQTFAEGATGASSGQAVLSVASAANLYAGEPVYDFVNWGALPAATTIKSVSGTSVTLNNNLNAGVNPGDVFMAGAYRIVARNTASTPNTITVNAKLAGPIGAADRIAIVAAGNNFGVCDGAGICNAGADSTMADPQGGGFSIDTMMDGLHTSGGLAGIRCYLFQGCYITNETAVQDPYGVLADAPPEEGMIGELLNVANSQWTVDLAAVYSNIVDQHAVQNYIVDGSGGTAGSILPDYAGIWSRASGSSTVVGNFLQLGGTSQGNELGIYFSCDSPNGGGFCGFPATVTGNALYGVHGYGISNSLGIAGLLVADNAVNGGTFDATISAYNPTGSNVYANNITGTANAPDYADEQFVTQGSAYHDLYLHELVMAGDGYTNGKFVASFGSGGTRVPAAWLDGASGGVCSASGGSHFSCRATMGGYSSTPGATFSLTNVAGGLFTPPASGEVTVYGEATCTGSGAQGSWHLVGHYNVSGGTASPSGFLATAEGDGDTVYGFGGSAPRITAANGPTFSLATGGIGVSVALGASSGLWDCSADLSDMVTN